LLSDLHHDILARNIRFAVRTLRRNRLFSLFAIATLGLGIGANAAIFQALSKPRLTATLLSMFALIALTVTLAGVSGVVAITVTQRLKEFGVRMALGASRRQVLGVVLKEGLTVVAAGLALGIIGSFIATRSLTAYLYETPTSDPVTLAAVCVTLLAAGLASCAVPALRATSADPVASLRAE